MRNAQKPVRLTSLVQLQGNGAPPKQAASNLTAQRAVSPGWERIRATRKNLFALRAFTDLLKNTHCFDSIVPHIARAAYASVFRQ